MSKAISLYKSNVMHKRNFPQRYKFNYKVFSLLLDIDKYQDQRPSAILSFNRFNIFSVYTKDHASRDGSTWRPWIEKLLDEHNLSNAKDTIKLLCFPRILGYAFNPLSLWYCYGENGSLYAVVCEVRNTFGEHHHYVLHNHNLPYEEEIRAKKTKYFHVSPFINMHAEYDFTLKAPDENLSIVIDEYQDDELMLVASQQGKQQTLDTPHLLALFISIPLMTFKVMWMIHWQALKIVIRGGKYHSKPPAPNEDYS